MLKFPEFFKAVRYVSLSLVENDKTWKADVGEEISFINLMQYTTIFAKKYGTTKCWELVDHGGNAVYVVFVNGDACLSGQDD
jgi:hypothetical protein